MNEIQIFNNPEFGQVRTLEENGTVLFCGSDVASALGYRNTKDAVSKHCKGVVKRDTPTWAVILTRGSAICASALNPQAQHSRSSRACQSLQ